MTIRQEVVQTDRSAVRRLEKRIGQSNPRRTFSTVQRGRGGIVEIEHGGAPQDHPAQPRQHGYSRGVSLAEAMLLPCNQVLPMRALLVIPLLLATWPPHELIAQESLHIAVEATSLVVDEARMRRLGIDRVVISAPGSGVAGAVGSGQGNVLIAGRLGDLEVGTWLELVRREGAVQRESTQRIVVLSGSAARLAGQQTVMAPFSQSASAGPELWVEPAALENGDVRLRIWAAVGEVAAGAFGTVWQEVPVEASTEVVVPSGTPVVIASNRSTQVSTERGMLSRAESMSAGQAWIVVTARIVKDADEALPMPAGIPEEWLRR